MKAALILLPLALAACSREPSVTAENASVEEVQAKIKEAGGTPVHLKPGRWESTMTLSKVEVPGAPAEVLERMQQAMAGKSKSSCLTPEEAQKPAAEFFAGNDHKNCRYDHFTMGGGTLDAKMSCGAGEASAVVAMKGSYAPEHMRMAMEIEQKGVPSMPQGAMTMAMTIDSKHAGACRGDEEQGGPGR